MDNINELREKLNDLKLTMTDELNIIELLNKKYNFRNLAAFAKENEMTEQGILKRKKNHKQQYIVFGNCNFYF